MDTWNGHRRPSPRRRRTRPPGPLPPILDIGKFPRFLTNCVFRGHRRRLILRWCWFPLHSQCTSTVRAIPVPLPSLFRTFHELSFSDVPTSTLRLLHHAVRALFRHTSHISIQDLCNSRSPTFDKFKLYSAHLPFHYGPKGSVVLTALVPLRADTVTVLILANYPRSQ